MSSPTDSGSRPATFAEREAVRIRRVRAGLRGDGVLRMVVIAAAIWLVGFLTASMAFEPGSRGDLVVGNWVYLVPIVLAFAFSTVASLRTAGIERRFWVLVAISMGAWLVGEFLWSWMEMVEGRELPTPSIADGFYMATPLVQVVAIVVTFGVVRRRKLLNGMVDASILCIALGWAGWDLLIRPELEGGLNAAALVSAAYPALDLLLIMTIISAAYSGFRGVPQSVFFVLLAAGAAALTDIGYLYLLSTEAYGSGSWINVGWHLDAAFILVGATIAIRHDEGRGIMAPVARDHGLRMSYAGLAVLLFLLLHDARDGVEAGLVYASVAGMCLLATRLHLVTREMDQVAQQLEEAAHEQERHAITDPLTGLHNRRFFEEMLRVELQRAHRAQRNLSLAIFDVDGFRKVNDAIGFSRGDDVLREVATRIRAQTRDIDVIASYSGEEFVALFPETSPDEASAIVERCLAAVRGALIDTGAAPVKVTLSAGVATLPDHARRSSELIWVADRALRTAKQKGAGHLHVGTKLEVGEVDELLSESSVLLFMQDLADEIDGAQSDDPHSLVMAQNAGTIADELGLSPEDRWACVAATRLHDVGKVGVPDSILTKPGPLTEGEWAIVRQHPRHGARIVALAEEYRHVAPIIEDHHERWDGTGYPAGKTGEQIELGARIIAVCDSWAAMRANRPYRKALSREEAVAELARCAGRQFDPRIVEIFLRLEAAGALAAPEPADLQLEEAPGHAADGEGLADAA